MSNTIKKVSALLLALAMLTAFMPMMQENAFAAKKAKKPAKVKSVTVTVAEDNQVTVTWKKAKNAKKYTVSIKDGTTKLTASKSSKKTKLTFKGGNAVKYTVKVQGVNGKKKGKFSKAVTKETNDLVKAAQTELDQAKADLEQANKDLEQEKKDKEEAQKAAEEAQKAVEAAKKDLADSKAAAEVEKAVAAVSDAEKLKYENVEDVQAARAAYDALTDEQKLLIGEDFLDALEDAEDACEDLIEIHTAIETASTCEFELAQGWNTPSELYEAPTVTLDGEEFCVVARNDELKKALLIMKGAYGEPMAYGEEGAVAYYNSYAEREEVESDVTGAWKYSPIRTLLNGDFLEEHPNLAKQAVTTVLHNKHIMLDRNWEEQVVDDITKDKVFLPSTNDAYRMASSGAGADTEDIPASGQPGCLVNYTSARNIVIDGEVKNTSEYQWWTRNCYNWSSSETYDNSANAVYVFTPNGNGAWDYGLYGNHKNAVETKCYVRPMLWFSLED